MSVISLDKLSVLITVVALIKVIMWVGVRTPLSVVACGVWAVCVCVCGGGVVLCMCCVVCRVCVWGVHAVFVCGRGLCVWCVCVGCARRVCVWEGVCVGGGVHASCVEGGRVCELGVGVCMPCFVLCGGGGGGGCARCVCVVVCSGV